MIFIAEIKPCSPFGFRSKIPWTELLEIATHHGDWVSVHVDPRWGGSRNFLEIVRKTTDKPILAKGFHKTDEEIELSLRAGADYVLVVDRIPSKEYIDRSLLECSTLEIYLDNVEITPHSKFVYNRRNLETGAIERDDYMSWKNFQDVWLCQASGIQTRNDVHPEAEAFIVGTHLPEFVEPEPKW